MEGFISSARATGRKVANALGKQIPEMVSTFVSGFGGSGWGIRNTGTEESPEYTAEFDSIRIRGTMAVHELVIQKIRAICGALGISQACGKVEAVRESDTYYYLDLEGDAVHGYGGFTANDYIRCQRWTEDGVKGYWVEIRSVQNDGKTLAILKSEFVGHYISTLNGSEAVRDGEQMVMEVPDEGDELVQYGNRRYTNRQTAIYIHANEDKEPAMDILFDINSKSFDGCLKVRLGGGLPDGGVGLYCENGHIVAKTTEGSVIYEFKPTGYVNLGNGQLVYDPATDTLTLGEKVVINWKAPTITTDTGYGKSSDPSIKPTTWYTSPNVPGLKEGDYLWSRTRMKYSDGTYQDDYIYSFSRIGKDGEPGTPGTDGEPGSPGKDGTSVTIVSTTVTYAKTTSNTRPSDSEFTYSESPTLFFGDWLWTRTEVRYSDGTKTVSYSAGYVGENGSSVRSNLLDHTDAVFGEEMYQGNEYRILANAATLPSSATVDQGGVNGSYAVHATSSESNYTDLYLIPVTLSPGTWYTLSFYAKGEGTFQTFLYPGITNTSVSCYIDGAIASTTSDGYATYANSKEWKRHFYTFKTKAIISGQNFLTIRIPKSSGQTLSVCIIRMEKGSTSGNTSLSTISSDGFASFNSSVTENTKDGTNGILGKCSNYLTRMNIYVNTITDKLGGGADYTLSFYARGTGSLRTSITNVVDTTSQSYADGEAENSNLNGIHTWPLTSEWQHHVFTFRTISEIKNQVDAVFSPTQNSEAEICMMKLESGKEATEWMESSKDRELKIPSWVREWDGHSTVINGENVVSPQAFFGEKDTEGKLTGVIMGARAMVLDGVGQNGLYALKKDSVMVAIDPVTGRYLFRGTLVADEGQFNGMVFGSYYKSNVVVTTDNYATLFPERTHYTGGGTIRVPDWRKVAQVIVFNSVIDSTGDDASFYLPPYYYGSDKIPSEDDYAIGLSMLGCNIILINRTSGSTSSKIRVYGRFMTSGSSNLVNYIDISSSMSVYLTCKISANGIIYFECGNFVESSNAPGFSGNVTPWGPDYWQVKK